MSFKQFKKKEPIDPVQALLTAIRGVSWGFIIRNTVTSESDSIDGMIIGNDAFVATVTKLLPANFEEILKQTKDEMNKPKAVEPMVEEKANEVT